MSEEEKKKKERKARISRPAIVSISFSILAFLILTTEFVMYRPRYIYVPGWQFCLYLSIAGFGIGLTALLRGWKKSAFLKTKLPAIIGMFLAFFIFIHWFNRHTVWLKNKTFPAPCTANLRCLGLAMKIYADDYGQYPDPNQWCDLLVKYGEMNERHFVCPSLIFIFNDKVVFVRPRPQTGSCYYALNPYCQPNSPPDTVLLFETNKGWNQFGGLELLSTNNHRGNGSIICFNDSHTSFEKGEFSKLKWKPEEVQKD
ncbi:MAG: hypothetical protein ACYS67_06055 [Planctomycetota bacterium]|jgi:hypothetical protein